MKQKRISSAAVLLLIALAVPAVGAAPVAAPEAPLGAISLTSGVPYTQDFDTLTSSGTSSAVPDGWAFSETGSSANTTYTAGTGSGTAGDTYSFGAISATERAFGGLQSGSLTPTIGAEFKNNSGTTVSSLALSYNCEEWRLGTLNRFDRMDFQYSTDATSLTTGTWVDADSLDCVTTNTSGTAAGARDGNDATYRTVVSYNVTGLSIASGATFWIRWNSSDASGADDGLAIDDFQVTAQNTTAVTLRTLTARAPLTPLAALPAAALTLAGGAFVWRRREA